MRPLWTLIIFDRYGYYIDHLYTLNPDFDRDSYEYHWLCNKANIENMEFFQGSYEIKFFEKTSILETYLKNNDKNIRNKYA